MHGLMRLFGQCFSLVAVSLVRRRAPGLALLGGLVFQGVASAPAVAAELPRLIVTFTVPLPLPSPHVAKGASATRNSTRRWLEAKLEFRDQVVSGKLEFDATSQSAPTFANRLPMIVKLYAKQRLFGTRRFVVRDPSAPGASELARAYAMLRDRSVLAPRLQDVWLVINGQDFGRQVVEEGFSKELNESQGKRTGVLFKLRVDALPEAHVDAFGVKKIADKPVLSKQLLTAKALLQGYLRGKIPERAVFDLELMTRFFEVIEEGPFPWMLAAGQLRFYFNPITQHIEPVGFSRCPCTVATPGVDARHIQRRPRHPQVRPRHPLAGIKAAPRNAFPSLGENPVPTATLSEVLLRHPFLKVDATTGILRAAAGVHRVKGSLVLPAGVGLELAPGTTLQFGRDEMLLAYGGLEFTGSEEAPVVLEGVDGGRWQGLVVLSSRQPVRWRHVRVRRTRGISRGSWSLTGGVTIRRSEVDLRDSIIEESTAEDALNLIHSVIDIRSLRIHDVRSDALDCDFCEGRIEGGVIGKVGGDGIDLSGSQLTVVGTRLEDIQDKAISVGEVSHLSLRNVSIARAGTAVAGKDGSRVVIENSSISDIRNVAIMAYRKKQEYGPAEVVARNIAMRRVARAALAQFGSRVIVDGIESPPEEVDVQALYKHGYMKK